MNTPLISIIMGTFNPQISAFMSSVNSILNQTYTNWELIICDDGSEQELYEKIQTLIAIDNRIICIRNKENKGLAYSLNRCITIARGKYIARMDDDDISKCSRLQVQVEFLENNSEYSWVGCQAELFDETGIWGLAERVRRPQRRDFLYYSPYIHPSVMFNRDIFQMEKGYLVSKLTSRCEDYELFMRFTAKGYQGYNLSETLLCYYENSKMMKRCLKYCLYEVLIRMRGFKQLGLLKFSNVLYIIKPIGVFVLSFFSKTTQKVRLRRNCGNHYI